MRALAAALFLLCGWPAAAQPPAAASAPGPAGAASSSEKYEVTLDASATDARGRTIDNLKPADFELTVDGVAQKLESLVVVKNGVATDRVEGRLFAIFLDEFHTSAAGVAAIAPLLTRFVDEHLGPGDRIVLMKPLDSLLTIEPAPDRAAVKDAIAAFAGRKGQYEPRNTFEETFIGRSPATVEHLRRQVTVSALNALAIRLGALGAGRKAILFVSEGFQPSKPVRGEEMLPTMSSIIRNANRHGVAIYGLDPAPASADDDILHTLAGQTDGQSADLAGASALMQRAAADSAGYYLLTWRPSVSPDGRFHSVQLRAKRAGVRVRTRSGVWLLPPEPALRAGAAAPPASPFELTPRHVSPLIDTWFGMTRGTDGHTRITFVWEPNGRAGQSRARNVSVPSTIAFKAFTLDGKSLYDGSVRHAGVAAETEAGAKAVFDAPPGRVHLEMAITGSDGRELDVDRRDVVVRDLGKGVVIGTPEILRARTALEFRTLATDLDAAPVASRTFSRAERLLVRFAAYAPDGEPVSVAARLLTRTGQAMRTVQAIAVDASPELHQIDLPLNGFAPGEYVLELGISATAGAAKELVNFRVTG